MRKILLLLAAIVVCAASAPLALAQTYRPSTYDNEGPVQTENPTYAYDGNPATYASLTGICVLDNCGDKDSTVWSGFPSYTSSGPLTLNITLSVPTASNGLFTVDVYLTGQEGYKAEFNYNSPTNETTVQWTVPAGTNLDTVNVLANAYGIGSGGSATGHVYEIWIQ